MNKSAQKWIWGWSLNPKFGYPHPLSKKPICSKFTSWSLELHGTSDEHNPNRLVLSYVQFKKVVKVASIILAYDYGKGILVWILYIGSTSWNKKIKGYKGLNPLFVVCWIIFNWTFDYLMDYEIFMFASAMPL